MIDYAKINECSTFKLGRPVLAQCCPDCDEYPKVDDVIETTLPEEVIVTVKCGGRCPLSWTAYAVAYWNGIRIGPKYQDTTPEKRMQDGPWVHGGRMVDLQHEVKEMAL